MVTTERWGSDITKGILQKVTLELILRMKRNLASQRERKYCRLRTEYRHRSMKQLRVYSKSKCPPCQDV